VLPNTGAHATEVTRLATEVLLEHGFEPQMSISLATERSAICVITISYDRGVTGDDARALKCYQVLVEALLARGYPPYRLPVGAMASLAGSASSGLMRNLKAALDPNGVLAPGRYEAHAVPAVR
jgi:4-cresol dehydrogenase (hydroxylating)